MKIDVLIDYDNLSPLQKSLGIKGVVQKIMLLDRFETAKTRGECAVRLYGGWYEDEKLTSNAEKLIGEIGDAFPTILSARGEEVIRMNTKAELAYSMTESPRQHLFGTYRRKQFPHNIRCASPAELGCQDPSCPLDVLRKFLKKKRCPQRDCHLDVSSFLYRNEQKLVDTMLTCDILHTHRVRPDGHVYVVSSDDDILPPILTIANRGMKVVRVHTKRMDGEQNSNFTYGVLERSLA